MSTDDKSGENCRARYGFTGTFRGYPGPRIIRVLDVETTGEAPPAKIVEIGWCDVIEVGNISSAWVVGEPMSTLVNPGVPIPPEISAIHHIIDRDVAAERPLAEAWTDELLAGEVCAFAAHMASFERQFITDEMTGGLPWVCTYKCSLRLWPDAPSHGNQALRYWRKPEGLDRARAMPAHRAGPDAYVTAHHLRDMLNGGALLEHMITRSGQAALQVRCHIGSHRGKKWADVDSGFLRWLLDKDFDEDVKFTARHHLALREKEAAHVRCEVP